MKYTRRITAMIEIKNVTKKNKVHAKEAMQVLEIYEKRHKNN
jgi:hypothetical protein